MVILLVKVPVGVDQGVTVTALAPGSTSTDFVRAAGVGETGIYRWLPRLSAEEAARAGSGGQLAQAAGFDGMCCVSPFLRTCRRCFTLEAEI